MRTRIFELKRFRTLPDAGGETLFFRALGGTRRHPPPLFRPEAVPEFEGDIACSEAERVPRQGWRIIRRVQADGSPYVE